MDGNAIGEALVRFVISLVVAAFALGALAVWALPKLWGVVKPWIHTLTS